MTRRQLALASLCAVAACTTTPIQTPSRSLDRPSDVALVCAVIDPNPGPTSGTVTTRRIGECSRKELESSRSGARLFLLVANTNRGEVALASAGTQWSGDPIGPDGGVGGIIDLDPEDPGFGFVPVGSLPAHVRASDDGRIAVTGNEGDCNLSVLDVQAVLREPVTGARVNTASCPVVPRRPDGRILGARPSWVEISPATSDRTGVESSGACGADGYRVIVAYPACGLVAEVDLSTQQITQAIRVTRDGARIVDPNSVECEAECRGGPFDGGVSDLSAGGGDDAAISDGGPGGLDLGLPPILNGTEALPHTLAIAEVGGRTVLYIGDAVGPTIHAVKFSDPQIDPLTKFESISGITLSGDIGGVSRIRLSRRVPVLGNVRYLYAIGRDNTVRVVEADSGDECETNPDPGDLEDYLAKHLVGTLVADLRGDPSTWDAEGTLRCLPADGSVVRRSALATGPGLTLPLGALPRDIVFIHNDLVPLSGRSDVVAPAAAPGVLYGDFAFIITSAGQAHGVTIGDLCPQPNIAILNTPNQGISCDPARFNNAPNGGANVSVQQPRALDIMPNRLRSGALRFVTPQNVNDPSAGGSRLLDVPVVNGTSQSLALATDPKLCDVKTASCAQLAATDTVAGHNLIAFRTDPLTSSEGWTIIWEGILPGTNRITGSLGATENNGVLDGATLFDAGAAFCTRGVRPGDKISINGCANNDECGADSLCFIDPLSPVNTRGLCVLRPTPDATDPPEAIRNGDCRPWSLATLRYRVVGAFQDRLALEEISLPEYAVDTHACVTDADCSTFKVTQPSGNAIMQLDTACRSNGHGGTQCVASCTIDPNYQSSPCGDGFVCAFSQFVESDQTKKPRCMRAPLPNAARQAECLPQLQRFDVRAGEAFLTRGDATGYLHDDHPDPADPISGECVAGAPASGPRRLLNGRIPLLLGSAVLPFQTATPTCGADIQSDWLNLKLPDPRGPETSSTCLIPPSGATCTETSCTGETRCYGGQCGQRALLRFDNPIFSLVLDVPLRISSIDTGNGVLKNFVVSRAPETGTIISFTLIGGARPFAVPLGFDVAAQMPRSAVTAPDGTTAYIVDEGSQTAGTGLRGQVLRFFSDSQSTDPSFAVR